MNDDARHLPLYLNHDWFDMAAVKEIVRASGFKLHDQQALSFLCHHLARLATDSMRQQLRNGPDSRALDAVIQRIQSSRQLYQDLENLFDAGILQPRVPLWSGEGHDCLIEESSNLRERRIRGRAEAWESEFYPRILGLYAVVSGSTPTSHFDIARQVPGSTVGFVQATIEHVIQGQHRTGYGRVLNGLRKKHLTWVKPKPNSTARKVARYLVEPGGAGVNRMRWEMARDEYRSHIPMEPRGSRRV